MPGSLLITLAALYFLGLTLNIFSMMGMMLAIGMLVDNAVVITESVFRHRQLTPGDPRGATLRGVSEVGVATLAGTLATIIVFVPLVFGSPSEITILMKHVAVPIVIAMVASLLVAQTIIPMLSVRITAPLAIASGSFVGRLQDRYAAALQWVLAQSAQDRHRAARHHRLARRAVRDQALKVDPFPQDAGRSLFLDYHIKGTHPLAQVEKAVNRIEAFLLANRERFDIESVYSRYDTVSAQTLLQLTPKDAATRACKDVMQMDRRRDAGDPHRRAELPVRPAGTGQGLQPAAVGRLDRAALRPVIRAVATARRGPWPGRRALGGAQRRRAGSHRRRSRPRGAART